MIWYLEKQVCTLLEFSLQNIWSLQEDGVDVKTEKSNSVTIPKYTGVITFKYLKNVE